MIALFGISFVVLLPLVLNTLSGRLVAPESDGSETGMSFRPQREADDA